MLPQHTDVAVIGAGPTGLTTALALTQAGIDTVVLDRAPEGSNTSRAAVIHARTLEVLDDLDISPRLLAEGRIVPTFTVRDRDRVLARIEFGGLATPYPFTLMLPQYRTEAILGHRLGELGGQVHRGWEASGLSATSTSTTIHATATDGTSADVTARFVVGADGMHSAVRQAAGIGFRGGRYAESFLLADVRMQWPLPTDEVQLFFSPAGLVVVAPLPGERHRIVATMDDAPAQPSVPDLQRLLDERGPGTGRVLDLAWGSRFRVHHRVADSYRRGPVLLAGDAAHVHSPAGGQGMNTGIQDAVDLALTLRSVLHGPAADGAVEDAALDGYQSRRRPVAQHVVALTDRATRLATLRWGGARTARNIALTLAARVPPVQHALARQLAELPRHPGTGPRVRRTA